MKIATVNDLFERSKTTKFLLGIPGFCEQILIDLLRKEKLIIVENDVDDSSLIEGDSSQQTKTSLLKTLFNRRRMTLTNSIHRVCLFRDPLSSTSDFDADFQQNFQNYLMCRIDRLSECESLLVKIAAVIGNTFSRSFLWHLVDPASKKIDQYSFIDFRFDATNSYRMCLSTSTNLEKTVNSLFLSSKSRWISVSMSTDGVYARFNSRRNLHVVDR